MTHGAVGYKGEVLIFITRHCGPYSLGNERAFGGLGRMEWNA